MFVAEVYQIDLYIQVIVNRGGPPNCHKRKGEESQNHRPHASLSLCSLGWEGEGSPYLFRHNRPGAPSFASRRVGSKPPFAATSFAVSSWSRICAATNPPVPIPFPQQNLSSHSE
jgi:hypothetical protein